MRCSTHPPCSLPLSLQFTQSAPRNPLAELDALVKTQAAALAGTQPPPQRPPVEHAPPPPPPVEHASPPPPSPPPPPPSFSAPITLEGATPGLLPASIANVLRSYQLEGVRFLWRTRVGTAEGGPDTARGGAVLCDDMGLGKTLQSVAFLAAAMGKTGDRDADARPSRRDAADGGAPGGGAPGGGAPGGTVADGGAAGDSAAAAVADGAAAGVAPVVPSVPHPGHGAPTLIVAPKSTLPGWKAELDAWCGFAVAYATQTKDAAWACAAVRDGSVDIVLTTYDTAMRRADFADTAWGMLVCDEAHRLKNPATKTSVALAAIGARARFRLLLSGTPVSNDLSDLYAVVSFAVPRALAASAIDFQDTFVDPISEGSCTGANAAARAAAETAAAELARLQEGIVLRRTKASVAADSLPTKRELVVFCKLGPAQRAAYLRVLDSPECHAVAGLSEDKVAPAEVGGTLWPVYHMCECGHVACCRCPAARCEGELGVSDDEYDFGDFDDFGRGRGRDRVRDCVRAVAAPVEAPLVWRDPAGVNHDAVDAADVEAAMLEAEESRCRTCCFCCGFPLLHTLKSVCNHVELLRDDVAYATFKEEQDPSLVGNVHRVLSTRAARAMALGWGDEAATAHEPAIKRWSDVENNSGKLFSLMRLLRAWEAPPPGDKTKTGGARPNQVLVFSASVRMLSACEDVLMMLGMRFVRLDGSVSAADRAARIAAFNRDPSIFVFLLSTRAGGEGNNLQAANRVVIVDPDWCPSKDAQAVDRAFRIGQTRDVHVYRLIAANTIESVIYARQLVKAALADTAVPTVGVGAVGDQGLLGPVATTVATHAFTGVKGDASARGELWGFTNLLRPRGDEDAGVETAARLRAARRGVPPPPDTAGLPALEVESEDEVVDVWALHEEGDAKKRSPKGACKPPRHTKRRRSLDLDPHADAAGTAALLAAMPAEEQAAIDGAGGLVEDHTEARRGTGARAPDRTAGHLAAPVAPPPATGGGLRGSDQRLEREPWESVEAAKANLLHAAALDRRPPPAQPPPGGEAALAELADVVGCSVEEAAFTLLQEGADGRARRIDAFWRRMAAEHGLTREDVVRAMGMY